MNDLTFSDKQIIEDLLQMNDGSGGVLGFSHASLADFFYTTLKIDINEEKYQELGTSKANRVRAFLKLENNSKISKALIELFKLVPLQNTNYSGEMLTQMTEVVKKLTSNNPRTMKADTNIEVGGLWEPDKIRIFISHRDASKKEAKELGTRLNDIGFTCFVAHDTIEPMLQWKEVIEAALGTMDGMVCFLTENYYKSVWTNQEFGYALAKDVPVFQFCKDKIDPEGFRMDIQAIRQGEEKLISILIKTFNNHPSIKMR